MGVYLCPIVHFHLHYTKVALHGKGMKFTLGIWTTCILIIFVQNFECVHFTNYLLMCLLLDEFKTV